MVKKMKKNKNLLALTICLSIVLAIPTLAVPVSAKNLNVPNAILLDYYNAGGQVNVNLQTPIQVFPTIATSMQFRFIHCEIPNSDVSFDNLLVFLGFPTTDSNGVVTTNYQPYAGFTTSSDHATFGRVFWFGTYMQLDATLYGINANRGTNTAERNNIRVVDSDVLNVERHGNSVTINLAESQEIFIPLYGLAKPVAALPSFTLPAFSIELNKYGDAFYYTGSATMGNPTNPASPSWRGASGMTIVHEELRFNANAVLTSDDLAGTATDAFLMMNGIHTFYPYKP
jgi:hypothetical protein